MSRIITAPIAELDRKFASFSRNTINRGRVNKEYVISQLHGFQTSYSRSGFFNDFILRLEGFALDMENSNLLDFAGIVFSKLAKYPVSNELREQFLQSGLRVARKQNDKIHILARIVDLKKLYEQNGDRSKQFKMLFQEEKALSDIIEDFQNAQQNHRTVAKKAAPAQKYKLQLARCKVAIVKRLNNPQSALSRLIEARAIYSELGIDNELSFTEKLIAQLSQSC